MAWFGVVRGSRLSDRMQGIVISVPGSVATDIRADSTFICLAAVRVDTISIRFDIPVVTFRLQ